MRGKRKFKMKTIPSLVATSTVGIAAAGLALGRPEPSSPSSKKRKATDIADVENQEPFTSPPTSRPGTSSSMITPNNKPLQQKTGSSSGPSYPPQAFYNRPSNAKLDSPNYTGGGRSSSLVRRDEVSTPTESSGEAARRDSGSSRGSWMRTFSTIPILQSNSPRSSIGPDTPSLTFSHNSGTPILSNQGNSPTQLSPNKLVKRGPSGRAVSGEYSRNGTKSVVPTLRRPTTSHQRSATLQQRFREDAIAKQEIHRTPSKQIMQSTPPNELNSSEPSTVWRQFFDSRLTKLTKEKSRPSIGSSPNTCSTSKRVFPDESVKPTLMKPEMITLSKTTGEYYDEDSLPFVLLDEKHMGEEEVAAGESPNDIRKRARRSFSMNFSSPTSWVSRTGSLRGKKNAETKDVGKRYSSAPVSNLPGRKVSTSHGPAQNGHRNITDPAVFQKQPSVEVTESPNDPFASTIKTRSRNSSSPLPQLSRLSSFNLDVGRMGLSTSPSIPHFSNPQTDLPSTPILPPEQANPPADNKPVKSKPPRTSEITDRASTLVDSDNEMKGFTSGEDEEVDFQSETVFDSLRSGATGSMRSHHTPLDAMFDESPPSVDGHSKKRVSVHELMSSGAFRQGNRIMEEDEGTSTPVRSARASEEQIFQTPVRKIIEAETSDAVQASPPNFSFATNDFSRLSLEVEDEDEDWTKDDEEDISNQLSPPNSSVNSRHVSPTFKAALADLIPASSVNGNATSSNERPKSNLFDWSEPSVEKPDPMSNTSRPKTAHVQQTTDGRGGRPTGRKGPTAAHIRSQSVPVVVDPAAHRDSNNSTPKFGTWGLGGKGVSEDWDNDFDFDIDDSKACEGNQEDNSLMMHVPPAIKASQAIVVGHVGLIREICLLVEDLRRLRNLAREKGLLGGSSAPLWKEAEGIIALAVPDEEDLTLSPPRSPSSSFFEHEELEEEAEDKYVDHGADASEISRPSAPFEMLNRHGRPTGLVYDGNSVRRRSVFSTPNDNIFGDGPVLAQTPVRENLRPPQSTPRHSSARSSDVARSVMETMHQHRSTSDPVVSTEMVARSANKMPFDTTSLRDLVHRASSLGRTLADLVRKSEGITNSPDCSPRREPSPAFTRVFTDPVAKNISPKHLPRSQSNTSILSNSMDASPTRNLGQRMHMMTVV